MRITTWTAQHLYRTSENAVSRSWAASSPCVRFTSQPLAMFALTTANNGTESFLGDANKPVSVVRLGVFVVIARVLVSTAQYLTEHCWFGHVLVAIIESWRGYGGSGGMAVSKIRRYDSKCTGQTVGFMLAHWMADIPIKPWSAKCNLISFRRTLKVATHFKPHPKRTLMMWLLQRAK